MFCSAARHLALNSIKRHRLQMVDAPRRRERHDAPERGKAGGDRDGERARVVDALREQHIARVERGRPDPGGAAGGDEGQPRKREWVAPLHTEKPYPERSQSQTPCGGAYCNWPVHKVSLQAQPNCSVNMAGERGRSARDVARRCAILSRGGVYRGGRECTVQAPRANGVCKQVEQRHRHRYRLLHACTRDILSWTPQ